MCFIFFSRMYALSYFISHIYVHKLNNQVGTVILTCWKEVPPAVTLTKMLTGKATKYASSVGYIYRYIYVFFFCFVFFF